MWPEFFIEALESRLKGCTGGDERDRGTLLRSLFVVPLGLGKLTLAVLGVDIGYGVVLMLDDVVQLVATWSTSIFSTPVFRYAAPNMLSHAILDEAVVWVLFHEKSRSKRKSLTACCGSQPELIWLRECLEATSVCVEYHNPEEAAQALSDTDEPVICAVVNPRLAFV